ncbi:hypothetical protein [Macrococcoides caseolyticum]|uniref:hypothetical protein n=1 Tax=Macrococcoides caseolyticum TaxID=69966 RepID=UPI001F3A8604|nr:hypothetical protein [Macrococcus caseolyticus]MCE4957190.1 hypothetical protein [Macrococcus caseolyticus]
MNFKTIGSTLLVSTLLLGACNAEDVDKAKNEATKAGNKAKDAAKDAGDKAKEAGNKAVDKAKETGDNAKKTTEDATTEAAQ